MGRKGNRGRQRVIMALESILMDRIALPQARSTRPIGHEHPRLLRTSHKDGQRVLYRIAENGLMKNCLILKKSPLLGATER